MKRDPNFDHLADRVESLRASLRPFDPQMLAARTGATYTPSGPGRGEFSLPLWGIQTLVSYPGFVAKDESSPETLPSHAQTLLLYYFLTSDGVPLSNTWISFSELPEGRFYVQAFQGYTGQVIARTFSNDLKAFLQAAETLGGKRESLGEASFSFPVLPHVSILAVYWLGDEDFPSTSQILFDAAISHHLPTDACAILGSTLTGRIIKAKEKSYETGH
jgi:hypothetical protein